MSLAEFVVPYLADDAEAFHEEDAAEDREQQLFVDDHSAHADDAANGQ